MNSRARTAVTVSVVTAALGLGATVHASAGTPRSVSGKPTDDITRIADFYGAYIDAHWGEHSNELDLGAALRSDYLTVGFQKQLNAWEEKNHADGVLRAQDVPFAWKVTDNGTAGSRTEAVVTLTWGGSHPEVTSLYVDINRSSHKIYRIATTGTGAK